jgi:disulfide oxidoreductase YuzD
VDIVSQRERPVQKTPTTLENQPAMTEFDIPTVRTVVQQLTNDETDQWAVVVQPPPEYDDDPRDVAERLFSSIHGFGTVSFEIHSTAEAIEIHLVVDNKDTADTIARTVRNEIGGTATVQPATFPIKDDQSIAGARFRYQQDTLFPLATARHPDDDGNDPYRHLLDEMAATDDHAVLQFTLTPVHRSLPLRAGYRLLRPLGLEPHWSNRWVRWLPHSIAQQRDRQTDLKRAGAGLIALIAACVALIPWPVIVFLFGALALLTGAVIGDGFRQPQRLTAQRTACFFREKSKEGDSRSKQAKNGKKAAEYIAEQADNPGWRVAARLLVGSDGKSRANAHRDRLTGHLEAAYSDPITGQGLATQSLTGARARTRLASQIKHRSTANRWIAWLWHKPLLHSTRRSPMFCAPFEVASLCPFLGEDGGGASVRDFASETDVESMSVPDAAPAYVRSQAVADGGATAEPDYILDPDDTETRIHRDYGEVETKAVEAVVDDDDDYYAGKFARELVETSERDSRYWFGYVKQGERIRELGITADQLRQHFFIGGASGAGKSTLAEAIILQHAWAGRGCAVIDPHDELVDDIIEKLPDHRKDDVIVLDPTNLDSEYTHTINFLSVEVDRDHPDYESAVNGAVDDTVGVICHGNSSVGDRMEDILRALTRGMIQSQKEYTFIDMRDILRSEERQQQFANRMREEGYGYIADFAEDIVEMSEDAIAPVTRLFNKWVISPTAREIISHTESSIDFRQAIDDDKIILLRNKIEDDELQQLVATAILKKIWRAAKQRPRGQRPTFPIISDETDDIHTPEMDLAGMLKNARKFGVSLTLMTQEPSTLSDIRTTIETNCKTFIAYACPSPKESRAISQMFDCKQSQIGNLGDYRSLIQLDIDGTRQGPFITDMLAPIPAVRTEEEAKQEIVIPSRRENGFKRDSTKTDQTIDENGDDQDDEDSQQERMDEFVRTVAHAAKDDNLQEDEHYTFVHRGKANEALRINPSSVVEALDNPSLDDPQEYTALSKELVEDETSYITGHRKRSPPVGRCLGLDLNAAIAPLSDVSRGMFTDR